MTPASQRTRTGGKELVQLYNVNTGRPDVRLPRRRYETMRRVLLAALPRNGDGLTLAQLSNAVESRLPAWWHENGHKVLWHVMTVKLYLEYEGVLERVPGSRPQRLRRKV